MRATPTSGCARMRAPGACNLHLPRHAREPMLERSATHRLMFQHSTFLTQPARQQHLPRSDWVLRSVFSSPDGSSTYEPSRCYIPTPLVPSTSSGLAKLGQPTLVLRAKGLITSIRCCFLPYFSETTCMLALFDEESDFAIFSTARLTPTRTLSPLRHFNLGFNL
jgi:hypothetical protein